MSARTSGPEAVADSMARASSSPRDRLMRTAARLFAEQGVHVGIDAVCRHAGVSKRSLYQLFSTKDELVAATLSAQLPQRAAELLPGDHLVDPRARILHVFEQQEALEPVSGFHGCQFLSVAIEVKSPHHPAVAVVRQQKAELTAFFTHEVRRMGAIDPDLLARQLLLVFDGASSTSVVTARPLEGLATVVVSTLLDASTRSG